MKELLNKLNELSPFTWEIETDGSTFTIMCEEMEVHDPETDVYLSDMTAENCCEWLNKLLKMEIGE